MEAILAEPEGLSHGCLGCPASVATSQAAPNCVKADQTMLRLCGGYSGCTVASYRVDNHDSGYLGMAVQLYVQAHLGHYHILTQKEYSQKLMAKLKIMPLLTYICII